MVQIDNNSKILCFRFQWVFNLFLGLHGRLDQRSSNATDLSDATPLFVVCSLPMKNMAGMSSLNDDDDDVALWNFSCLCRCEQARKDSKTVLIGEVLAALQ